MYIVYKYIYILARGYDQLYNSLGRKFDYTRVGFTAIPSHESFRTLENF